MNNVYNFCCCFYVRINPIIYLLQSINQSFIYSFVHTHSLSSIYSHYFIHTHPSTLTHPHHSLSSLKYLPTSAVVAPHARRDPLGGEGVSEREWEREREWMREREWEKVRGRDEWNEGKRKEERGRGNLFVCLFVCLFVDVKIWMLLFCGVDLIV